MKCLILNRRLTTQWTMPMDKITRHISYSYKFVRDLFVYQRKTISQCIYNFMVSKLLVVCATDCTMCISVVIFIGSSEEQFKKKQNIQFRGLLFFLFRIFCTSFVFVVVFTVCVFWIQIFVHTVKNKHIYSHTCTTHSSIQFQFTSLEIYLIAIKREFILFFVCCLRFLFVSYWIFLFHSLRLNFVQHKFNPS